MRAKPGLAAQTSGTMTKARVVFKDVKGTVQVLEQGDVRVYEVPISRALRTLAESLALVGRDLQSAAVSTVVVEEWDGHPFTMGPYIDSLLLETLSAYGVAFTVARLNRPEGTMRDRGDVP